MLWQLYQISSIPFTYSLTEAMDVTYFEIYTNTSQNNQLDQTFQQPMAAFTSEYILTVTGTDV